MEQNSVSVEMTNIGSLMFKVELLQKTEDVTLTSPIPSGLQVEKTSPWMVHCGVHGKVPFSSTLENLKKGCPRNIPAPLHVFQPLTQQIGKILTNHVLHFILLNTDPYTIFYLSGKFDGGDVDVDGDLDVDVQDTLGHFVVHCHQARPLLVLGNTDGVGRIKLISSPV